MLYSLVVTHDTLHIPDRYHVLNNAGTLIIHARAAIQVVYHHYVNTLRGMFVECWNINC